MNPFEDVAQRLPSIGVSATLPTGDAGNATCPNQNASTVAFEVVAVSGLTVTVEAQFTKGGSWYQWPSIQVHTTTFTSRIAGTTLTLAAGDIIIVSAPGAVQVRLKRAAGTSATISAVGTPAEAEAVLSLAMLGAGLSTAVTNTPAEDTYATLLEEAAPSMASSAQIFANAPAATKRIWLTVRAVGITMTTDGTTAATASAHGLDFAVNSLSSPYVLDMNQTAALLVRAIQQSATATAWIVYRG